MVLKERRYRAFKYVSEDKEYEVARADNQPTVVAEVRTDSPGLYRIYDYQPPEPGRERSLVAEVRVDENGTHEEPVRGG